MATRSVNGRAAVVGMLKPEDYSQHTVATDPTALVYPCADCGALLSADQGGAIFTVCDRCWDRAAKAADRE